VGKNSEKNNRRKKPLTLGLGHITKKPGQKMGGGPSGTSGYTRGLERAVGSSGPEKWGKKAPKTKGQPLGTMGSKPRMGGGAPNEKTGPSERERRTGGPTPSLGPYRPGGHTAHTGGETQTALGKGNHI